MSCEQDLRTSDVEAILVCRICYVTEVIFVESDRATWEPFGKFYFALGLADWPSEPGV